MVVRTLEPDSRSYLLEAPEYQALAETARVTHFTCSAADETAIRALLGGPVDLAGLRRAVRQAATSAATWSLRAAALLDRRPRSGTVRTRYRQALGTTPEFVPTWRPASARWRDRGELTAIRLRNAARILQGGSIRYFCWVRGTYCPECGDDSGVYACSSWGQRYVVCLGEEFLRDWQAGRRISMASTLLHEALHIYFEHLIEHAERERYGNVNCYVRFALTANSQAVPQRILDRCPVFTP